MKKQVLLFIVCTLAAACASAASVDWSSVTNLASGKTVYCATGTATGLTDGNTSSAWGAQIGASLATSFATNEIQEYFVVDFEETTSVTHIALYWEASHPKAYSLYVTDSEPQYDEVTIDETTYKKLNSSYLSGLTAVTTGGEDSETSYDELLTGAFSGRYYIVYVTEYNNWATTYGIQPYEFMAANISSTESNKLSSTFTMSDVEVVKGSAATVTVSLYTVGGDAAELSRVSNLTLTCDDSAVTITSTETTGTYTVSASDYGIYTLTATATGDDDEKSTITGTCTLTSAFDWENNTNVALNKTAYASSNSSDAQNATDGNTGTRWQAETTTSGEYLYVDLGAQYKITALTLVWEAAYATAYTYYYATETGTDGAPSWTKLADVTNNFTWDAGGYEEPYELESAVVAQYVKIEATSLAMTYGVSFYEFRVAGTEYTTTVSVTPEFDGLLIGESVTLSSVVTDADGNTVENAEVTYTIDSTDYMTLSGSTLTAVAKGTTTVTATYNDTYTGTTTVTVAADPDNLTATRYAVETDGYTGTYVAKNAIDGDYTTAWMTSDTDADVTHTLTLTLLPTYDVELVRIYWGTGNSCAYTLQTAAYNTTAENGDYEYTTVYTYSGEAEVATRTDRIFGIGMSGTDYIKLISTKNNAANSGLTIYEIECYGTKSNTQTSGISNITLDSEAAEDAPVNVYSITGTLVRQCVEASEATDGLTPGFYIVGNKKVAVK